MWLQNRRTWNRVSFPAVVNWAGVVSGPSAECGWMLGTGYGWCGGEGVSPGSNQQEKCSSITKYFSISVKNGIVMHGSAI